MSGTPRRTALLLGTEVYRDGRFAPLPSCGVDVEQMRQVLEHHAIGAFPSVDADTDRTADEMRALIAQYLESLSEDDLALLYITGHGVRMWRSSGEFFFIATDTDFDRVPETGIAAGYVNDLLEACAASQKIVVLDCCQSGGFAVGWRTRDEYIAKGTSLSAPLTSRGAYIMASSGAGEDSFAGGHTDKGPEPSIFTGHLVEALRTGRAARNTAGTVTVDDLFDHVNQRMRALHQQIPEKSSLAVNDRIILASCPQGVLPTLKTPAAPRKAGSSDQHHKHRSVSASSQSLSWDRLIAYYSRCVQMERAHMPLLEIRGQAASYVCLSGTERLICGDVDGDGCIGLTEETRSFLDTPDSTGSELWAGYPVIVFTQASDGRPLRVPQFAPLVIRRVEVVTDDGSPRLRPYGPVLPHSGLAHQWLGKEQAEELLATYRETWRPGQQDAMAEALGALLRNDFQLPILYELKPHRLDDHIDVRSSGQGAHNVAVLFRADPDTTTTKGLLDDLARIQERLPDIDNSALAALLADSQSNREPIGREETILVTPLPANHSQRTVLNAAMKQQLTVATGPPGTGKSQLVVNMIATVLANDQRVLLASTNNKAVDEVWQRCEELLPSCLLRTGNTEQRSKEMTALQHLASLGTPPDGLGTAWAKLHQARRSAAQIDDEVERLAVLEQRLAEAGKEREQHARTLGLAPSALAQRLGSDAALRRWQRRARRAANARLFSTWRRNRVLRRLELPRTTEAALACEALASFAATHERWLDLYSTRESVRSDTVLADAIHHIEKGEQKASLRLLARVVETTAASGSRAIRSLMLAREERRRDWPVVKAALPYLRAWAVTSLSARRFPPDPGLFDLVVIDEASQCSIPQIVPLLFRARRALIIGDVMQLPHISTLVPEHEALIRHDLALKADLLEKHKLAYRRHSAFHAAEGAVPDSLLLQEHYRCHPDIAALANRIFYGNALTILTDTRRRSSMDRPPLLWVPVNGRAIRSSTRSSWLNLEEVDKAIQCVGYLFKCLPDDATIGVVTPFKAQQELLDRRLAESGVQVGTIHTFQGAECDVIVLSLVAAGQDMPSSAIGWIERQPNLWNVAITRARSHLIVIGDTELWRQRGGIASHLIQAAEADVKRARPDDFLLRLHDRLTANPDHTVQLDAVVHGHRVDARVEVDGQDVAVILDRGPAAHHQPGAHLHQMLRKTQLLQPAVRVPAWRLYGDAPISVTATS
ncbi:caspase, EACC1-associated type [Nonomuraea angiospora]